MEVIVKADRAEAAHVCAAAITRQIREHEAFGLGLATGRTVEPVYAELVRRHRDDGLSFAQTTTFNLDEYIGLPPTHPQSYRYYMNHHLFDQVDIDPTATHLPDGMAEDIARECQRYEDAIHQAGGIDLQLLGIGSDGHIGFNEPGSSLQSVTRHKTLNQDTIEQNQPLFDNPDDMPFDALTMGMGTIMNARHCLMLATGAAKAGIVAQALEGPVTAMVTASALQMHPLVTVVLDEDAAAELQLLDYHRWAYERKPDWQRLT